jgi:hypothetical protein
MSKEEKAKAARIIARRIRRRAAMLRFRKARLERQREDRMHWLMWCCCFERSYKMHFFQRWTCHRNFMLARKAAAASLISSCWRRRQVERMFVALKQKHTYLKKVFQRMTTVLFVNYFKCWKGASEKLAVLERERAAAILQLTFRNHNQFAAEKLREQTLMNIAGDHSTAKLKLIMKKCFIAWKAWHECCVVAATCIQSHWLRKQALRQFADKKRQLNLVGQLIAKGKQASVLKCFTHWVVFRKQCRDEREREAVGTIQGCYRTLLKSRQQKHEARNLMMQTFNSMKYSFQKWVDHMANRIRLAIVVQQRTRARISSRAMQQKRRQQQTVLGMIFDHKTRSKTHTLWAWRAFCHSRKELKSLSALRIQQFYRNTTQKLFWKKIMKVLACFASMLSKSHEEMQKRGFQQWTRRVAMAKIEANDRAARKIQGFLRTCLAKQTAEGISQRRARQRKLLLTVLGRSQHLVFDTWRSAIVNKFGKQMKSFLLDSAGAVMNYRDGGNSVLSATLPVLDRAGLIPNGGAHNLFSRSLPAHIFSKHYFEVCAVVKKTGVLHLVEGRSHDFNVNELTDFAERANTLIFDFAEREDNCNNGNNGIFEAPGRSLFENLLLALQSLKDEASTEVTVPSCNISLGDDPPCFNRKSKGSFSQHSMSCKGNSGRRPSQHSKALMPLEVHAKVATSTTKGRKVPSEKEETRFNPHKGKSRISQESQEQPRSRIRKMILMNCLKFDQIGHLVQALLQTAENSNGVMEKVTLLNCHLRGKGTLALLKTMAAGHVQTRKRTLHLMGGFLRQLHDPATNSLSNDDSTNEVFTTSLHLNACMIGPGGAAALSAMMTSHNATNNILRNLTQLDLSANGIGDLGCAKLATILPECEFLESLNVSDNDITSHGIACVCDGLELPLHNSTSPPMLSSGARRSALRVLRFSKNPRVGNAGLALFLRSYLKRDCYCYGADTAMSRVCEVNFSSCGIDGTSGRIGEVYQQIIDLEQSSGEIPCIIIDLHWNLVTDAGFQQSFSGPFSKHCSRLSTNSRQQNGGVQNLSKNEGFTRSKVAVVGISNTAAAAAVPFSERALATRNITLVFGMGNRISKTLLEETASLSQRSCTS